MARRMTWRDRLRRLVDRLFDAIFETERFT